MSQLPPCPYPADQCVRVQAYALPADKDFILTVVPDRNLYNLLIQHAIKRTADFIRTHDLSYGNPDHRDLLIRFITDDATAQADNAVRGHAAARAARDASTRDVAGRAAKVRESHARVQNKRTDTERKPAQRLEA